MTKRLRKNWLIVGANFLLLFFVMPSVDTTAIFVPALVLHFGWSRARVALISTGATVTVAVMSPIVGRLLERIEAYIVLSIATSLVTCGLLLASVASGFTSMLIGFSVIGLGVACAYVPVAVVISNWFHASRGRALSIALTGESVGAMVMILVVGYAIPSYGWRTAFRLLAAPILFIATPCAFLIRTRPPASMAGSKLQKATSSVKSTAGDAFHGAPLWLILLADFFYALSLYAVLFHFAAYLMGIGYSEHVASLALSAMAGLAIFGQPLFGTLGDRLSGRVALSAALALLAAGVLVLQMADHSPYLLLFVFIWGLTLVTPNTLFSMVLADNFGLTNFASLSGIMQGLYYLGIASGGVLAGWIYDLTGSYARSFYLCCFLLITSAAAILFTPTRKSRLARESMLSSLAASHHN